MKPDAKGGRKGKEESSEEAQDGMGLDQSPSAIKVLLNLSTDALKVEDTILLKRLGIQWKVKALDFDEFDEIGDRSVRVSKSAGKSRLISDDKLTNVLMVYYGSVDPNLNNVELFKKHGVSSTDPVGLVKKILLPGEIAIIAGVITKLSGFDDIFSRFVEATGNL